MEQVVVRLAAKQQQRGHRVQVLAIHGGPLSAELAHTGIPTTILGSGRVARAARALKYFLSIRADIVHAHNPTSLHYAVLSQAVSRAGLVITLHGERPARTGTPLEWRMVKQAAVVSHAAMRALRLPCGPEKISVIHNGIAAGAQSGAIRERMRSDLGLGGRFVGVIVARLSGQKGHATLLQALAILSSQGVDVAVLVVGDGPVRPNLQQLAVELSLEPSNVAFLGARGDVEALLSAADFFVLPSDTEGLPLSVLEAMSHGLPIVASHVGGIPELIVSGREGVLVPPADPVALAAAIRQLADDQTMRKRLGESARKRAEDEFSLDATVHKYDRLYHRALGQSDCAP